MANWLLLGELNESIKHNAHRSKLSSNPFYFQGFTYPVRAHFLENILETTGYRLTPYNQIDDYGQEKAWKMQKQAQALKKRKTQIASSVEV